jgi:TrkA domain protein
VDVTRSTIPGVGHAHELHTRGGQRFAVVVERDGRRQLVTYAGGVDDDAPAQEIVLDADEADQLADLLHQRSVADRLAALERRVAELAGSPAGGGIDA